MEQKKRETDMTVEWLGCKSPHFRYREKEYCLLNNQLEVEMGGVLYRVQSVFTEDTAMGDVLDALTMEKLNRLSA